MECWNRCEVIRRHEPDMVTIRISEIYRQVPGFGNCEREGWLRAVRRQLVAHRVGSTDSNTLLDQLLTNSFDAYARDSRVS